jgi:predicted RND superfamily exporter protein
VALLSPSLAIAVTFALLGWFGIQFSAIMSIMPFLVLGIGVDNAFLLLHSWKKWKRAEMKQQAKGWTKKAYKFE